MRDYPRAPSRMDAAVRQINPWVDLVKAGILLLVGILLTVILWLQYGLMQQKKEALQEKDRFFSNISHDMRTPLNAVIWFAALARKPGLTTAAKEGYLEKIASAGTLLLELVNDTLVISRGSRGKLTLQKEPVETAFLLESVLAPVRVLAERKGIALTEDVSACRPRTVEADGLNIQKIFLNLLSNAVNYTPAGGHILVTAADDPQAGDSPALVLSIKDDGIGMSPDFLEHLYEPFSQEKRPGYEGTGTGLGLAIVKQFTDLMGGTITVESELNRGTTFTVRLPLQEVQPREKQQEANVLQRTDLAGLAGKKVLVCEDNEMNRDIARALLEDVGLIVHTAANGRLGVEQFAGSAVGEYSLILMDIRMPVMDGYEAARQIRRLPRVDASSVPIVAVTADVFADEIRKCQEAGMDGYLAKPVDLQALYRILLKIIVTVH